MKPRPQCVSDAVLDVAALGYDLNAELTNPAPDLTMRRVIAQRLAAAVQTLTTDERQMLARRAGR